MYKYYGKRPLKPINLLCIISNRRRLMFRIFKHRKFSYASSVPDMLYACELKMAILIDDVLQSE